MKHKDTLFRTIISLAAIIMMTAGMKAQEHYRPHISVGGHAGMTLSNMTFVPSVQQKMTSGITFGATFRYAEERNFGLIAELNISQRGWSEDFKGADFSYTRTLTYIELPLLTHIYFGGRRFKGFVNLGPQIGYMIGDKITADFDYRNPQNVPGFPTQNRMLDQMWMDISKKFDYGITGGAGCEFYIRPRHSITLEARYYFGIGNIFPDKKRDIFSASRGSSIIVT
ncbi:MAG: PorT family protein [Muribaculaceae bacterium]|nr:PorT family protein [Muribaculaceae bacterium]